MKAIPCKICGAETRRQDRQCQNCAAVVIASFNQPSVQIEIQRRGGRCSDCGFGEEPALRLFMQRGEGGWAKCPGGLIPQLKWALKATEGAIENFFVRCLNCHERHSKASPGRPRRYENQLQREEGARERMERHKAKLRMGIAARYHTCMACEAEASCIHWIGPHAEGPRGNQYDKFRRILQDPEYASQFAGFCEVHKPAPYFTRASRGEVPKPIWWKGHTA